MYRYIEPVFCCGLAGNCSLLITSKSRLFHSSRALGLTTLVLAVGKGFATDASIIKADAQRQRRVENGDDIDWGDPAQAERPVREYLAALEETNDPKESTRTLSLTYPAATWTAAPGGPAFFAYSTNYLIDLEAGIILDVEASAVNKAAEAEATRTMMTG